MSPQQLGVSQGVPRAGGGGARGKNGASIGHGQATGGRSCDLLGYLCVFAGVRSDCVLFSQQSRHYGALFGHSASQAGLALPSVPSVVAVPALRCPPRAFGEPSRTCSTPYTFCHSSPGVTVSSSGIRRAKLDLLYPVYLLSQQSRRYGVLLGHSASQARLALPCIPSVTAVPALRCPPRAFGEPS